MSDTKMDELGGVSLTRSNGEVLKLDQSEVKAILQTLRRDDPERYRWDLNIVEGQEGERTLHSLLSSDGQLKVETKRDFKAACSGNIVVEYEYKGKPSGIQTSEADWWAFIMGGDRLNDEVILMVKKERLRKVADTVGRKVLGGDNRQSLMTVMPIRAIFEL